MIWTQIRIKTTTEAEDILIATLYEIGLEGAQIEDKIPMSPLEKEQMFVDILPEMEEDDGVAYLNFYMEDVSMEQVEEMLSQVKEELEDLRQWMDIGEGSISVSQTEDLDWINNWKNFFHQFMIDDLLIIPSWEEANVQKDYSYLFRIDPGTAFGTGMHETTQLCIRQLRRYIRKGSHVLDIGTGSGILGMLSLMFGAEKVVGTDLDLCARDAVETNLETNGLSKDQFLMHIGNLITDEQLRLSVGYEAYDVVVANILAEVLVELMPVAYRHLKPGGTYIMSGILNTKEMFVREAAIKAGFRVEAVHFQGEWVGITVCKGISEEK